MNVARRNMVLTVIAVTAITAIAAVVRSHGVGRYGLSIDEIVSMMFSTGRPAAEIDQQTDVLNPRAHDMVGLSDARSLRHVWRAPYDDTHPPLHPIVLRGWRAMFGEGDVPARSLSIVFATLCIPLLFDTARLLHGRTVALWTVAIFAVTAPQIDFAQQVRGYSMLLCFVLATLNVVVRIETFGAGTRQLMLLSVATLLAALTHYNALPIALIVAVYAVIRLRSRERTRTIIALLLAAILFSVIQAPTLWHQRTNFGPNLAWLGEDRAGLLGRTLLRLAGLPLRLFIVPMSRDRESIIGSFAAILYVAPIIALTIGKRRDLLLWCLVGGVTIAIVSLSDFFAARRTLELVRFTLAATPAACALAAAMTSRLKNPLLRHAVPATFVLGCLLALPTAYAREPERDLRGFAQAFDRAAGPNDVIVIPYNNKRDDWYHATLIAAITHYSHAPNRQLLVISRPINSATRDQLRATPGVWFVHRDPVTPPIDEFMPGATETKRVAIPYVGSAIRIDLR